MVNGTAAEVLKHRRNDEQIRRLAASQGIQLKSEDLKPVRNKKFPYYTPARNKDVFNARPLAAGSGGCDVFFGMKYHRRNDIQVSIHPTKQCALFIDVNNFEGVILPMDSTGNPIFSRKGSNSSKRHSIISNSNTFSFSSSSKRSSLSSGRIGLPRSANTKAEEEDVPVEKSVRFARHVPSNARKGATEESQNGVPDTGVASELTNLVKVHHQQVLVPGEDKICPIFEIPRQGQKACTEDTAVKKSTSTATTACQSQSKGISSKATSHDRSSEAGQTDIPQPQFTSQGLHCCSDNESRETQQAKTKALSCHFPGKELINSSRSLVAYLRKMMTIQPARMSGHRTEVVNAYHCSMMSSDFEPMLNHLYGETSALRVRLASVNETEELDDL